MSIFNRLRKPTATGSATAISATASATASSATLLIPANQPDSSDPVRKIAPVAVTSTSLNALLARFRLDLSGDDYRTDERRTNNIAFHLVIAKGLQFDEAIVVAAQWVVSNPYLHPREAGFTDVRQIAMTGDWFGPDPPAQLGGCLNEQPSQAPSTGAKHGY